MSEHVATLDCYLLPASFIESGRGLGIILVTGGWFVGFGEA